MPDMNDILIPLLALVFGLLAGGLGSIFLLVRTVGREEADRALARQQIEDIEREARRQMLLAWAAQQPGAGRPAIPAFRDRPNGIGFGEAESSEAVRLAAAAGRAPRGWAP